MSLARLGVVGDVHAEDRRLETALRWMKKLGVDRVLAVGDLADGYGDLERCCRLLREADALVVTGNHDRWFLEQTVRDLPRVTAVDSVSEESKAWIRALPTSRALDTAAGKLLLCHGIGDDDMAQLKPDDYGYSIESNTPLQTLLAQDAFDLMIGGHTHRRMARTFGRLTILNAGTLHRDYPSCFLVADCAAKEARWYDLLDEEEVHPADTKTWPVV